MSPSQAGDRATTSPLNFLWPANGWILVLEIISSAQFAAATPLRFCKRL
jgi:hypothetical protein